MTLHLYFARGYLRAFLAVSAAFMAFMTLFETLELSQRFGDQGAGIGTLMLIAALRAPSSVYRVLPVIAILAALAQFLRLARRSELIAVRAAGRSGLVTLIAPLVTVALISVILVMAVNPIVAVAARQYDIEVNHLQDDRGSVLAVGLDGLWLREGSDRGQTVIHASAANRDGTELTGATFFRYDEQGNLETRLSAASAELEDGGWTLRDGKLWRLRETENPETRAFAFAVLKVPSSLTRERIREGFGEPDRIGFWDMPGFVARMEAAGFSARTHRVFFQMELAKPVLLIAMVMIGAAFTMRHTRGGRTGVMLLLAVICGLGLYLLRNFAQILGESGEIPIALAAWAPPIAACLLAMSLLLHLEDG